ncbi:tRNA dihydrouridine synthase DusB [Desulfobotulus sp. H1]|uniref:tRNA-dihydrouridine synthase n=1 Tax=Desulfobotulus pelophilus TaxID=2823377 RepID=A0ABT3N6U7_9BACT|nr:tRNA dihydrouridine synthase DusB [Desulfobotulus pelophilus]MCW7753183.1 tRNA dihydrouridine synthase DusB [Desulfobotulus pelophilus]
MTEENPSPENKPIGFKPFTIGNIQMGQPTVLAPLAGVTDLPFRRMVKGFGCGLVCSEMVSANGLVYGSEKTRQLMASHSDESPLCIQIFGSDPAIMAEAAAMAQDAGAHILDINFGCSVRKVLKSGSGSALMQEPEKAAAILSRVRRVLSIPLTIKMRSGWTADAKDALTLARIAEDCGVNALTLHPRTARQGFGGRADWSRIKELKRLVTLPVIGNGDILTPEDALFMLVSTGCDAVMIGRAALHSPHIFRDIHAILSEQTPGGRNPAEHLAAMGHYIEDTLTFYGEETGCRILRSRLGWLVKGLPGSTRFRSRTSSLSSREEALALLADLHKPIIMTEPDSAPEKP